MTFVRHLQILPFISIVMSDEIPIEIFKLHIVIMPPLKILFQLPGFSWSIPRIPSLSIIYGDTIF